MNGRTIVVGVSGGVAAYKTAMLVSRLVQSGATVRVVLTAAAEAFVGPATFAALTGYPVARRLFDETQFPLGAHIELAEQGEVLCVAPATANFLAKAAHGLADDLLSTLYLAFPGPVLMVPTMNQAMWKHPAVQRNLQQVQTDGARLVEPGEGWLSCRQEGKGRMAEPETILEALRSTLDSLPARN
jgi:phosphopantothenoylcysteine decarboxylase